MTREIDLDSYTFDLVVNATTGQDLLRESEVIGCSTIASDIEAGLYRNNFSWEFPYRYDCGDHAIIPEPNTEYYLRIVKDRQVTRCFVKPSDSDEWILDFTTTNEEVGTFPTTKFMFGNDIDVPTQHWEGTINLRKSYIVINNRKYLFKPEPHIVVPTIFTFSDIPTEEYDIHDVLTQDWMVDHGFGNKQPTWFKNLVTATIGESTTSLGDASNGSAFSRCQTLTRLVIPDNVTSIGYGTCFTCMNLETLELGNGVTYIGP